jgi:hypothetical protein
VLGWSDITEADIDDTEVLVDGHPSDSTSMTDILRLIAATDGGTVYIDGNDTITFRSAQTRELEFSPVLTISAGDLAEQPSATQNDTLLCNDVTVNRVGADSSQRRTSPSSIAKWGVHDKSIDTLCASNREAAHIAGYYIAFFAQPLTRFDTISIEALLQTSLTGILDSCESIWKVIRITDLPPTAPATTLDSHVEGWEWSIDKDSWLVTFDISYAIPFAIVGDATRGIMGSPKVAR